MAWQIRFTVDLRHDVVVAEFDDVVLTTEADVTRWRREVSARFEPFGRKVDLLIDLKGLVVQPGAGQSFGRHRAEVLAKYTVRSYRYGGDRSTRTAVFTSSVLHGAAANVYADREAALKQLLDDRKRDA